MEYDYLKKDILVFDIETSAHLDTGKEINIKTNFDAYVLMAECKWFGAYSYKKNKYYNINVKENRQLVIDLLKDHDILVGFNSVDFDYPILLNNNLTTQEKNHLNVDCMTILGKANFKGKDGYAYKNRGYLMDYNFKSNSLRHIAEVMGVETQKGDIDYKLFNKKEWTNEEQEEIIKYLEADVRATKQIFDKLWDYWMPFTDLLYEEDIKNLSWIRSSIASLVYKSACNLLNIPVNYGESSGHKKEEMGGRVIEPRVEEKEKVWYVDFSSLYPHIMCMFNLFSEVPYTKKDAWHGNNLFKVKGYYDITEPHGLSLAVQDKLKKRIELKKTDPKNPMIYTLKIWLNGLYGIVRSAIFKQVHTPNAGWDCCLLGQQIHEYAENRLKDMGFESIYGDTDGLMCYAINEEHNNKDYIRKCLQIIVNEILDNVPFPVETFNIDIEDYLEYIMFPFSDQPIKDKDGNNIKVKNRLVRERKGKKKNYLYIYEEDGERQVKLVGLPIMKDNATHLGIKIYEEVLKEKILETNRAKFSKEEIDLIIKDYLKKPDIMDIISIEYKIKPFISYKNPSQLQAQISKEYLGGGDGIIKLIKNKKVGSVGKGSKYCTIQEAIDNQLTIDDLDLKKLYNELEPFILRD